MQESATTNLYIPAEEPIYPARILVVDDLPTNIDVIRGILQTDYKVQVATSGKKALAIASKLPSPDLILLDIMMPEMDGLIVLKEIRAVDPHAPVIILGGGATEAQENQARALRVTDFVRKGLSLDVLVEAVHLAQQLNQNSLNFTISSSVRIVSLGRNSVNLVDEEDCWGS